MINAKIGYGLSLPYQSATDVNGTGFYAQGEFVLKAKSWVDLIPYAGVLITNSSEQDDDGVPTLERVEAKAFNLGGKIRLRIPIPYVAPYAEFGIGASIGSFRTLTAFDNIDRSGVIYHVPWSVGLEFGKNRNVDIGFTYLEFPDVNQVGGAAALGIKFKL